MKIVHINATDARGGATISMMRHSEAMNRVGIDSKIVVASSYHGIYRLLKSIYYRINNRLETKLLAVANFSVMNFGIPLHKNPIVKEADVIMLHWVCANTLSIKGVEKILKLGKPTFWFLHDMWPFTGGCHYSLSCNGYLSNCANCPQITNEKYKDYAEKQLAKKIKHWNKYQNLEFVSPSSWEAECIRQSSMGRSHPIHVSPNILDTDIYTPQASSKVSFGLNPQKKTILFGATRIASPYKGSRFAHECLSILDPDKYEGLVIGKADTSFIKNLPIKVVQTGYLNNDLDIAKAYNACDTFIMTSIAESFGQVVAEAMACGKPCVGFPTGGVLDLILHKKTGFLTRNYEACELKDGIDWLFADESRYNRLSLNARQQIVQNNSFKNVLEVHKEILTYL